MISRERDSDPSQVVRRMEYDEAIDCLVSQGKPILFCGMVFVGGEGAITRSVSILQSVLEPNSVRGWVYRHRISPPTENSPIDELEGLRRIHTFEDLKVGDTPETMFAAIAEVDPILIDEGSEQIVKVVVNWAVSQDGRKHEEIPFKEVE